MADQHQIMAIIATAIHDCSKEDGQQEPPVGTEQAKHIAKCIWAALSDAGLQVVPAQQERPAHPDA